jgi:hypothetical protein
LPARPHHVIGGAAWYVGTAVLVVVPERLAQKTVICCSDQDDRQQTECSWHDRYRSASRGGLDTLQGRLSRLHIDDLDIKANGGFG